jgi:hypothetical protein
VLISSSSQLLDNRLMVVKSRYATAGAAPTVDPTRPREPVSFEP